MPSFQYTPMRTKTAGDWVNELFELLEGKNKQIKIPVASLCQLIISSRMHPDQISDICSYVAEDIRNDLKTEKKDG